MKEYKNNVFRRFADYLVKKYKAPEECKLVLADKNLYTMVKAQIMLIIMAVTGIISIFIVHKNDYYSYLSRFIYFGIYIVFGILCILTSNKLKKAQFYIVLSENDSNLFSFHLSDGLPNVHSVL